MKYKVGDIVRIREDLQEGFSYGVYCAKPMLEFAGKVCTIVKTMSWSENICTLKDYITGEILGKSKEVNNGEGWHWSIDMLENASNSFIKFLEGFNV